MKNYKKTFDQRYAGEIQAYQERQEKDKSNFKQRANIKFWQSFLIGLFLGFMSYFFGEGYLPNKEITIIASFMIGVVSGLIIFRMLLPKQNDEKYCLIQKIAIQFLYEEIYPKIEEKLKKEGWEIAYKMIEPKEIVNYDGKLLEWISWEVGITIKKNEFQGTIKGLNSENGELTIEIEDIILAI